MLPFVQSQTPPRELEHAEVDNRTTFLAISARRRGPDLLPRMGLSRSLPTLKFGTFQPACLLVPSEVQTIFPPLPANHNERRPIGRMCHAAAFGDHSGHRPPHGLGATDLGVYLQRVECPCNERYSGIAVHGPVR